MKKYKIGLIGYGGFGKFLHHWWAKLDQIEVVAVADSSGSFPKDSTCRLYDKWEDLINNPEIDIVSIVTPPSLHAAMACVAMKAGKHVLLEKPAAITLEDAAVLLKVESETGSVITVNHMIRYNPLIQGIINLGELGVLGKLRHAAVHNYAQDESLPPEHWFWNEKISGGIMVEHGVHFFDIVSALSGQKSVEVYGCSDQRNEKQRDRMSAMVKYDGGLIAEYYHAFSGPGYFEQTTLNLVYDLARFEIEGWMPMKGTLKAIANEKSREAFRNLPEWQETTADVIGCGNDDSRPEGWGTGGEKSSLESGFVKAGGISYNADHIITGAFQLSQSKGEVYGKCVQDIILDIISKIEDKDHALKITLADGVEALKTALLSSHKTELISKR